MTLIHEILETPVGPLHIVLQGSNLIAVAFTNISKSLQGYLLTHYDEKLPTPQAPASPTAKALRQYFGGELKATDNISVKPKGTLFQQEVWEQLRKVPPGETASYGDIARAIGRHKAVRAVGQANALNPIAIIVPCHRIVGAKGALTGYAGGLERKRWLLTHEGALTPSLGGTL